MNWLPLTTSPALTLLLKWTLLLAAGWVADSFCADIMLAGGSSSGAEYCAAR